MTWIDDLIEKHGAPECGFECGDGWRPLVEYLYDEVDKVSCASVSQVKEKYGTLRLYIDHRFECDCNLVSLYRLHDKIGVIEALSGNICEECGSYGTMRKGSWIRTLCDECDTMSSRPDQA